MTCPACNGPRSKRALLCASCRRRAIRVGVDHVLTPTRADPRSTTQNSAYHGKCSTLAELELGFGATRAQISLRAVEVKHQAMDWASESFGRSIGTSKEISYAEMSDLLDWLDQRIASESTAP